MLEIEFTAKRVQATDWRKDSPTGLAERGAYRIPLINSGHVITPRSKWSTMHTLTFGGRVPEDIHRVRMNNIFENAGLDRYYIFESDMDTSRVTIEPIGSGFMARITIRVPFKVHKR